jgi:hypothetical protein
MAVHLTEKENIHLAPKNSIIQKNIQPYSIPERIFRTAVFRFAVKDAGLVEKFLTNFYKSCSQCKLFPETFDEARAERSLNIFKSLGAEEDFIDSKGAMIHMITLQSTHFETILENFGATWEQLEIIHDDDTKQSILAIVPHKDSNQNLDWTNFETNSLLKMGWRKEKVTCFDLSEKEVIITCNNADLIDPSQWHQHCFLYSHSTSGPFIRDRTRAGVYLGMKQDFCFFDSRGIWKSNGIPSEAGSYLDIKKVHKQLLTRRQYNPIQTWVVGYCGGGPAAAYLKAKYHASGINFIAEQSFSDFKRDFLDTQQFIAKQFAHYTLSSLSSRDIPIEDKPPEYGFSVEALWKDLEFYDGPGGKVILIHAENDQRLSEDIKVRYAELSSKVNASVTRISFKSPKGIDAHSDDFYHYQDAKRQFVSSVFKA